jgi:hypothetical protein
MSCRLILPPWALNNLVNKVGKLLAGGLIKYLLITHLTLLIGLIDHDKRKRHLLAKTPNIPWLIICRLVIRDCLDPCGIQLVV